jgi:magnesium-transporting ATPase (P-type)
MIHFNNKTYKYKVLYNLEFNSYRNKQSIIIENEDGEIYLYCKGADSMINKVINKQDSPFFVKILEDNYYYGL